MSYSCKKIAMNKLLASFLSSALCLGVLSMAQNVQAEETTELLPSRQFAVSTKAGNAKEHTAPMLSFANGKYTTADTSLSGSPVTVDGDLGEWGGLRYSVNQQTEATIYNNICTFDSKWNAKYLSIAVDVVDSDIVKDFTSENIYENDSVEIFIDADHSKGDNYDGVNDYHFFIQYDGTIEIHGGKQDKWTKTELEGVFYSVKEDADGFNVEVNIPFESLGITAAQNTVIGLEVSNNDNDSHTSSVRHTWLWNKDMAYNLPNTWGILYLGASKAPLVANPGTPTLDKPVLSEWDLSSKMDFQKYIGATNSFGAMCDNQNLYLGFFVEDPDGSFNTIQTKETDGEITEHPPVVQIMIDGDNTASGARDEHDVIIQWRPTESFTQCHYVSAAPNKTAKAQQFEVNGGYFLLCTIPWNSISPLAEGTNLAERDNFSLVGIDIMSGRDDSGAGYFSGGWVPMWGDQGCNNLGRLFVNNSNVSAHINSVPQGTQLYAYAIAQGTTLKGKIEATDKDSDPLTYTIIKDIPADEGSVKIDSATGEWTYTPPSDKFVKPAYIVDDPLYYGASTDPVGVNFVVETSDGLGGILKTRVEIKVLKTPTYKTYYVDGDIGSDSNSGLYKDKPLKTIQAAHLKTNPGDTVIIFESEIPYGWSTVYSNDGPFVITRSGLPEAYITYKAAPGEKPVLKSNGEWNTIIVQASYVIFDGLTIEGLADEVTYEQAWDVYYGKEFKTDSEWGRKVSVTNTNGMCIEPTSGHTPDKFSDGVLNPGVIVPNHIIVRNCTATLLCSGGIGTRFSDYVTIENCVSVNNGWWGMYASSGLGSLGNIDVDNNTEDYKIIFRNNISIGNRHFIPWVGHKALSDGNGILIDSNNNTFDNLPYRGKILIENNLVYENGGSGIHSFRSDNVDVINNTVLYNNATPHLNWGELFNNQSNNFRMYNNIVYSRTGCVENPVGAGYTGVEYDNNIFYNYSSNSNIGKSIKGVVVGINNLYPVDPQFTNLAPAVHDVNKATYPSTWSKEAIENAKKAGYVPGDNYDVTTNGTYDVALKATSPAFGAGNAAWSEIVGNTDNVIGIYAHVGLAIEDYELPADPVETDEPKDTSKPTDTDKNDDAISDTETDEGAGNPDDGQTDDAQGSFPTAIIIVIVAVIVVGAVVIFAVTKSKKK